MTRGSIYQVRSKISGKCYIGQTQDTKERDGKPYRYGVSGRWSDHVSSAYRGAKTPLSQAILENGPDDFELTVLECDIAGEMLDEREAYWIATRKTTIPDGFNVMRRHARCKHRENSTLGDHYLPTTTKVRIASVKRGGVNKLVYVYLDQNEGDAVRLVFGQGASANYAEALLEAQEFATKFAEYGIVIYEEDTEDPFRKYREKIESVSDKKVERIRIAKFNHLIALHIKHNEGTLRICFGGKTIPMNIAYKTALRVKNLLMEMHAGAILQDEMSESATGDCL